VPKPGVEHGRLTATVSCYMEHSYAIPHHKSILGVCVCVCVCVLGGGGGVV
jgi:hypothetical protein